MYLHMQVIWKCLFGQTSCNHGTLGYFKSLLNQTEVSKDPKNTVDSTVDFLLGVVTGHIIAVAFEILGVTKLDSYSTTTRSSEQQSSTAACICEENFSSSSREVHNSGWCIYS